MSAFKILAAVMISFQCMALSCMSAEALAESFGYTSSSSSVFAEREQRPVIQEYNPLSAPGYPSLQNSYFTDDYGNILMIVNVLGEVNRPGQIVVRESADFATIFALVGGLRPDANLTKVLVARQEPDKDGQQAYRIDLKKYYKHGDRGAFIALKPNDTIIIPEKGLSLNKIARIMGIAVSGFSIYNLVD
ncbi:MAG: SLBB domain-containing protein [Chlorobium sp.]|uniref:polysaccharide biosynthesis/export family protein n=1 Tax=Chlorobium sp. TaxID=1095 RepID=UPI0025BC9069|nr:SLBB domain-containing protein [Chlorobium sp.]MCF8384056.1 SLBB domain-containing protein [Chlorobium sp.]